MKSKLVHTIRLICLTVLLAGLAVAQDLQSNPDKPVILNPLQADGSGALVVPDTDPQTAALKGNAGVGANGTISFQLSNVDIQPSMKCSTKLGTATITASDGKSTINMVLTGLGCAIDVSLFPDTVTAAYVITGGTGIFAETVGGTGSFSWGILADQTPGSEFWIHISGNIQ